MVELDAFYMDIHEVMVDQFKQFVQESGIIQVTASYEVNGTMWLFTHRPMSIQ